LISFTLAIVLLYLKQLLPFIDIQQKLKAEFSGEINWGYSIDNFMTGFFGIHPNFARYLRENYPSMTLVERYETFKKIPYGKHYSQMELEKALSNR